MATTDPTLPVPRDAARLFAQVAAVMLGVVVGAGVAVALVGIF